MKFEEKIKEKLDERVITPSNNSWERLSQQLDEKQQPLTKSKRIKDWYRVAAIFVGVLFITSILVYQNSTHNKTGLKVVDHTEQKTETAKELPEIKKHSQEKYEMVLDTDVVSNETEYKSLFH